MEEKIKKGSKWGVAIATVTSKEYERYGTTLTQGMFYLLFPVLNVQQSSAAGHCCAGWWPALGSTCIFLVGCAWREAPHFQCWQAGPKANSAISTATSAPNSSACWWSAPPLQNTACSQFINQLITITGQREIHTNLGDDKPVRTQRFFYLFVVF